MTRRSGDVVFDGRVDERSPDSSAPTDQTTRRHVLTGAIALGVGAVVAAPLPGRHLSVRPAHGEGTVWLNIRVETNTSSQGQHSWASAWTSSDREGQYRVAVEKLHFLLEAHRRQEKECVNCDYLRIDEWHDGPEVAKARASAWSEGPKIGPVESTA
jgi:hypothetical protein